MDATTAINRARELVLQMSLEEKASVLLYNSPAIDRLGIKEYNWWNEASHGVARSGMATVFPHAIALASTFDTELVGKIGKAISDEARAKYNNNADKGDFDIYKGLTYWTPNINIFRDPRWGRGQETFGEDPFLTSSLAVEYIKALQGDGEFLKTAACAKHYAVHSGPESIRHSFDAKASLHDLWETYLPAFEKSVEAGVAGVMGAYNRTNGEPCCANQYLMKDILRNKWGFDGYFVSDCGAIFDIYANHKCTDTLEEAAALALKSGCNLNCGDSYHVLLDAYEQDLVTEEDITEAAVMVMSIRFRLGEFEEERPYKDIPFEKIECEEHRRLNLEAARECMVLLKNDGILPLDPETEKKIAVIGPNAMSIRALEGNYNGMSSEYITPADGIRKVFRNADIRVCKGANIWFEKPLYWGGFANMTAEGVGYAENSDITILCLGLDSDIEGEETNIVNEYFNKGDKNSFVLPKAQIELAEKICDVCDNVIVLVEAGSCVDLGEKITAHARAIIHGWYPGAVGGLAAAELISGAFCPNGRLPVTFYREGEFRPEFTDYSMTGKTYRYYDGTPLYPFGFGLSYTRFEYSDPKIEQEDDEEVTISFNVRNTGDREGKDTAQVYASFSDSRTYTPKYQLCGIKKINLKPSEFSKAELKIEKYWMKAVLEDGRRVKPDGDIVLYIGGHQPDELSKRLSGTNCISINL